MNARAPSAANERGVALVWVALLALGLFGLLGASVDLGLARLTQQQMQAATDAGALEGLRWRDAVSDGERRVLAALVTQSALPDGVGPAIDVRGGATANELGQLVLDDSTVVSSRAQQNVGNAPHGDLVAGELAFDPGDPEKWFANQPGAEGPKYERDDFTPAAPSESAIAPAFLARLRRTRDDAGLDRIPGVSSGGPPIPWLFALGSALDADTRRRGITVRATSLANAAAANAVSPVPAEFTGAPITLVGQPVPETDTLRLPLFGFLLDAPHVRGEPMVAYEAKGDGQITGIGEADPNPTAPIVGVFFELPDAAPSGTLAVGDVYRSVAVGGFAGLAGPPREVIVPVLRPLLDSGSPRPHVIVGFQLLQMTVSDPGSGSLSIEIRHAGPRVLPAGATAAFPVHPRRTDRIPLFAQRDLPSLVLAPTIVR